MDESVAVSEEFTRRCLRERTCDAWIKELGRIKEGDREWIATYLEDRGLKTIKSPEGLGANLVGYSPKFSRTWVREHQKEIDAFCEESGFTTPYQSVFQFSLFGKHVGQLMDMGKDIPDWLRSNFFPKPSLRMSQGQADLEMLPESITSNGGE